MTTQFANDNPHWREQVDLTLERIIRHIAKTSEPPPPWDAAEVRLIGESAIEAAVLVFTKFREQIGEEVFGELILLIGQEAEKHAERIGGTAT